MTTEKWKRKMWAAEVWANETMEHFLSIRWLIIYEILLNSSNLHVFDILRPEIIL